MKGKATTKKSKGVDLALNIVWWLALACFLVCAGLLGAYQLQTGADRSKLSNLATAVMPQPAHARALTQEQLDRQVMDRVGMMAQLNPDLAAWISIDNTEVNYPVMQTKSDPEYYLRRNFDKQWSLSGLPFLDAACDITAAGTNAILYGHNMQNGTMFAVQEAYKTKAFWEENPIIRLDTSTARYAYKVFGVVVVDTDVTNPDALAAYRFKTGGTKEEFDAYMAFIKQNAMYDTGIVPAYGSNLLTLSTCTNVTDTGRIVLLAVRQ